MPWAYLSGEQPRVRPDRGGPHARWLPRRRLLVELVRRPAQRLGDGLHEPRVIAVCRLDLQRLGAFWQRGDQSADRVVLAGDDNRIWCVGRGEAGGVADARVEDRGPGRGLGSLERPHGAVRRHRHGGFHRTPTLDHQCNRRFQIEHASGHGGAELANGVANHSDRPHAMIRDAAPIETILHRKERGHVVRGSLNLLVCQYVVGVVRIKHFKQRSRQVSRHQRIALSHYRCKAVIPFIELACHVYMLRAHWWEEEDVAARDGRRIKEGGAQHPANCWVRLLDSVRERTRGAQTTLRGHPSRYVRYVTPGVLYR